MMSTLKNTTVIPSEMRARHFDPHVHGRLPPFTAPLLQMASQRMCGGCLEPNTAPQLLLTADQVHDYVNLATEIAPTCTWSASIYLTTNVDATEVEQAWNAGELSHVKGYPPGGTTHSGDAPPVEVLLDKNSNVGKTLCFMAEAGIPFK